MAQTQQPTNLSDLPCFRCTFTQEFHDDVITSLAKLNAGQEAIMARLERMDSSQAKLWQRTDDHDHQLVTLNSDGSKPLGIMRSELAALTALVTENAAKDKGARGTFAMLSPVLWMFFSMITLLLFQHATEILPLFGKK